MRDLLSLAPGNRAVIEALTGMGWQRNRLLDMGFTPGALVEMVRKAPGGDPVAYRVRGAVVALRSTDARTIIISAREGDNGREG